MRRPAVFFDRDNTLIVGNDYLGDPAGVVLVPSAADAVAAVRLLGFVVVVVSNQSGVARGMFSEEDVSAVNRRTDELLLAGNPAAVVDRHEYCPHHPDGTIDVYRRDCECRKPKAGMIHSAAAAMALDLPASWMIGDAPRDVAAGRTAGCRTVLIVDPTLAPSPAALAASDVPADFVVASLVEAIDVVTREASRPLPQEPPPVPLTPAVVEAVLTAPTTPSSEPATAAPPATRPVFPAAASAPARNGVDPTPVPKSPTASAFSAPAAPVPSSPAAKIDLARLETASQQILMELRKLNDTRHDDFSISKLIAGITQTLALAALPLAYVLYRSDPAVLQAWLSTAIFLQAFTIALLVMGRQR